MLESIADGAFDVLAAGFHAAPAARGITSLREFERGGRIVVIQPDGASALT